MEHSREVTPAEAYQSGRVSLRGAIKLAGLLDVHPSLIASSKRRDQKKRIRRPGQQGGEDQVKITLADALKQVRRKFTKNIIKKNFLGSY